MPTPLSDHGLFLSEIYETRVRIKSKDSFFSGKLLLSPAHITLTISADLHPGRTIDLHPRNIEQLSCESFNRHFVLVDLNAIEGGAHSIDNDRGIRHYYCTYKVSAALVFPLMYRQQTIDEIGVYSPTVASWVGETRAQHDYLTSQGNSGLEGVLNVEIPNRGSIEITYNTSRYYDQSKNSAGVSYQLFTVFSAQEGLAPQSILNFVEEFRTFFEVIEGGDPQLDKITLDADGLAGYLYLPVSPIRPRSHLRNNIYPLGRELTNPSGLPEFPAEAIASYFSLNSEILARWRKSVTYRHLGIVEDRFLGAFRLLEAFTTKKAKYIQDEKLLESAITRLKPVAIKLLAPESAKNIRKFLARLPSLNRQRYNTAACIMQFYKTLPHEMTKTWRYQLADIEPICNRRNDITHANPYFFTDTELQNWTSFIELLLFVALLDSIHVPREATLSIIGRHDAYWTMLMTSSESSSIK